MLLFVCLTSRVLPGTLISIFFLIFSDSHDRHKGGTSLCLFLPSICMSGIASHCSLYSLCGLFLCHGKKIYIYSFEIIVYDGLQLLRFAFFYKLSYLSSKVV